DLSSRVDQQLCRCLIALPEHYMQRAIAVITAALQGNGLLRVVREHYTGKILQQLLQFRAWLRHIDSALLVKGMGLGGCRPWLLVDLRLPLKYPAARIMAVANMCVIRLRSGSSEQNELAARPELLL